MSPEPRGGLSRLTQMIREWQVSNAESGSVRWQRCPRCAKERHVDVEENGQTPLRLCKGCESEMFRERDECPEYVSVAGGWELCGRRWHHSGRCEPVLDR